MEEKRKRLISVIRWPNGFVNLVRVDELDGAMLEQEVDYIIDNMCKDHKTDRSEVEVRIFNVSSVEIKDRLTEERIKEEK